MRFSLVEAVNQAWSAVSGSSAATVLDKLQDRHQRHRIIRRTRDAIGHDAPTSARQLAGLLDTDWFVELVAKPGDPGTRAAVDRVDEAELARWFPPDVDPDVQRDQVIALAAAVWSVAAADATVVEAVHSALLGRIDETTTYLVNIGLDTYRLVEERTDELKDLITALPERITAHAGPSPNVPATAATALSRAEVPMVSSGRHEADLLFDRDLVAATPNDDVHAVLAQAAARARHTVPAPPVRVFVDSYSDHLAMIRDEWSTTDPEIRRANARARDSIDRTWATDPIEALSDLAAATIHAASNRIIPSEAVGRVFASAATYWRRGRQAHSWDVSVDLYRRRDLLTDGRPAGFTIGLSHEEVASGLSDVVRQGIRTNDAEMYQLPDDLLLDRAFGALLASLSAWERVGLLPPGARDPWATYFGWKMGPG